MDCEAEGPPTSIISRAECNLSQVIFMNVQRFYKPNTDIQCTFCRGKNFASRSKDWIGIFKVGWKTTREYCSWILAWTSVDDAVLFKAYFLPKDDDYYQFCYVDYKGEARGTSIPFQFSNIPEDDDDILMVTTEMEMRTDKEKVELKKIVENLTKENTQLQEKVSSLQNETQAQAERIQNLQDELLSSSTKMQKLEKNYMAESDNKIKKMGELHMTIANLEAEVKRLKDECKRKMEAERTIVRQLKTQLKSAEETMQDLERQLAQQKSKMEAERTIVRQLKTHLQSAEETMQDLERQLAQQKDICRQQGEEVLTLRSALELIEEDLKDVYKYGSSNSSTRRRP